MQERYTKCWGERRKKAAEKNDQKTKGRIGVNRKSGRPAQTKKNNRGMPVTTGKLRAQQNNQTDSGKQGSSWGGRCGRSTPKPKKTERLSTKVDGPGRGEFHRRRGHTIGGGGKGKRAARERETAKGKVGKNVKGNVRLLLRRVIGPPSIKLRHERKQKRLCIN